MNKSRFPEHRNGSFRSPTYHSWRMMKERCLREKQQNFKYYGALGVKVCDRWLGKDGFANFLEDMGPRPKDMTLDREDPFGNYDPDNCRWATTETQAKNKRKNVSAA